MKSYGSLPTGARRVCVCVFVCVEKGEDIIFQVKAKGQLLLQFSEPSLWLVLCLLGSFRSDFKGPNKTKAALPLVFVQKNVATKHWPSIFGGFLKG